MSSSSNVLPFPFAIAIMLISPGVSPCGEETSRGAQGGSGAIFTDETTAVGLDFVHFNGAAGDYYFPEIMGSGGALLDIDNDGDLDLYLCQGKMFRANQSPSEALMPPDPTSLPLRGRLYRNDLDADTATGVAGRSSLRFVDATEESGLRGDGFAMGAAAADYDNDGWVDLYLLNHGPNQLWHNNGDGTWSDVTAVSQTGDPRWSITAVFFDYDRDGWLDLFVANYVASDLNNHKLCHTGATTPTYCSPALFPPLPDRLYHNNGDGTFEDVTTETGIAAAYGPGLGAVAADLNDDGWLDLYVANDGQPNQMWINQGGRGFTDEALLGGTAVNMLGRPQASMGVDVADFDGDGDDDLFMTHLDRETNTLYVNQGEGLFVDQTVEMGLAEPSKRFTGFGTSFFDYDNDGDLDVLVVNGEVSATDELAARGDDFPYDQPNQLFHNDGNGRFHEVTAEAGPVFAVSEISRGAMFGDLDNDGDTDVVISNNAGPARVLLNQVGAAQTWLGLRLLAAIAPRDALGARVELVRNGAPSLWRRCHTDGSYASANDPRVLLGLGDGRGATGLRIHWPQGSVEEWPAPKLRTYTTLRQGSGQREE